MAAAIRQGEGENLPGPDRYAEANFFGRRQGEIACDSRQYTMGIKIDKLKQRLKTEKKLPGPGYYEKGDDLGNSAKIKRSVLRAEFSKADDRWNHYKLSKGYGPPVSKYNIKDSMDQHASSSFRKAIVAVFGSDSKTYVDVDWKLE